MPAPDISRPTKVDAKLAIYSPGASLTQNTVLTCPANTDTIFRIRTAIVSNQSGASATGRVGILRGGVHYFLAKSVAPNANAVLNVVDAADAVYLEPGDALTFTQVTANSLVLFVNYEVIT